jgi:hypothetical protein
MYKDPNSYSMQLQVPHSIYGACTYFIPIPLLEWLTKNDLKEWGYCGGTSAGNGFTDGVDNRASTYMIYNIKPEDATAFGIQFPHVRIHLSKQYDHT